ncbi:MAG: MATE family efflux transporter [Candidatus Babeliales bacterium]
MNSYLSARWNKLMSKNRMPDEEVMNKKSLLSSYAEGIFDTTHGESYRTIFKYFLPEFVTSLVLYALIPMFDARWIACLKSTSLYATMGATNTLLHFIIKTAEGFSVGTVILTGQYNGRGDYKGVGKSVVSAFWVTVVVGGVLASLLYWGAETIYVMYGLPTKMIQHGIPVLRLRAVSIFFMFLYFALIGFLRGIKKPRVPMQIFIVGAVLFLLFDYVLIFGTFGFPALGVLGSAWASVIQYGVMLLLAIAYVVWDEDNRKYGINLFTHMLSWSHVKDIMYLSIPVVLDKALFAAAYIWLGTLINPMGKYVIASYQVIRDLERFAIQPAAAFAQVITYLVSNSFSVRDWQGIKSNIKKTVFLSSIMVCTILVICSLYSRTIIQLFDTKGKFTEFSATVFPVISILVFFDLLQLVLSGALRGAANVQVVFWTRLVVFAGYFLPVSIMVSWLPLSNQMFKFMLLYCLFYVGSGFMSLVYIYRFRGDAWKQKLI